MLPFSHFVAAKTFGGKWEKVLDYAAANPSSTIDELNRVFAIAPAKSHPTMTVDIQKMREVSQDMIDLAVSVAEKAMMEEDAENSGNFTPFTSLEVASASGELITASTKFLVAAQGWKRAVEEGKDGLPDSVKDRVRTALTSVMKELPDMVLMLDVV